MFARMLIAGMVFLLTIGCAKRAAKNTPPARDEVASAKPRSPAESVKDKKGATTDEPNWLTDTRFQKETPTTASVDGSSPNKQPWVTSAPQGGWTAPVAGVQPTGQVNPMPVPVAPANPMPVRPAPSIPPVPGLPPGPGMGALQPDRVPANPPAIAPGGGTSVSAVKTAVTMADMREVWVYVENRSGASGKMPAQLEIYQALVKGGSPAADRVKDGTLTLTGATARESVWAYETRALTDGGLVASQNGVETLTAAELRQRLGK